MPVFPKLLVYFFMLRTIACSDSPFNHSEMLNVPLILRFEVNGITVQGPTARVIK